MQKLSDLTFLKKILHLQKFLMTFFYSFTKNFEYNKSTFISENSDDFIFSRSHEFSPVPKPVISTKVQMHTKISYHLFSSFHLNCSFFTPVFDPHIYNYNCTIHLLQLQMTFYNSRNCDQLHIKICPVHTFWIYLG